VACYGSCALAPVVVIDDKVHARMTPKKTAEAIATYEQVPAADG
jgi:NADH-quinone oxidoreductase subunit E